MDGMGGTSIKRGGGMRMEKKRYLRFQKERCEM